MSPPMKLSKAINILRAARGNLSLPQFDQLMHEHEDDERLPSVRLSSLKVSEVARVLCLSPAENDQGWDSAPTVPLSELLVKSLALVDDSLSCETSAETIVRWRMNYFLLCALDIATASGSKEEQLPKIDLEPKWSFGPVQYNDQAVKLTGYPYYALWYGEKDEAASNVIVTQGQGFGGSEEAIAEVLGYMGFIHHHRKNAKKEIFPLYGIATDSRIFHFIKLDNDSTFVTATLDSETDLQKAFSLLVHILKEAVTALSMQPSELSTQSDRGEAPSDPSIPAGASLRRRVDKKAHYRMLRATADDEDEDSESEDVDDEDLEDDSSDDSSEDETSEDNKSKDE